MMKFVLVCLVTLFLVGCAAGPNTATHTVALDKAAAGFWLGLWHGTIAPITFIISLFSNKVNLYEVHNNGGWYNLGFLLGIGLPLLAVSWRLSFLGVVVVLAAVIERVFWRRR